MASSPRYKVYSADEEYRACFKHLEDAASFVAFLGKGATIRDGHSKRHVVWHEGHEDQSAAESFDYVYEVGSKR